MAHASLVPADLSFHLLEEITDGFSEQRKLGSGSYGKVYMGVHKDGAKIAVKVLLDMPELDDHKEQFQKEFNNLASLQHQNIVRLVGYCYETRKKYIEHNGKLVFAEKTDRALCFEYIHNGSLDKHLTDECSGLDWHTRYTIIKGICKGLKYLHDELEFPMFHLDLKPANILLDENMVPKIADFGLSRLFGGEQTLKTASAIGTVGYVPPEYTYGSVISIKFDIFSLGAVILKIMTGADGYYRSAEIASQQFIERVHGKWRTRLQATSAHALESYSEQVKRCIEIALSCVESDRHKRPSIGDIINKLNWTETLVQFPETSRKALRSSMDEMSLGTSTGSEFLDIHPVQLRFPFEPNKLISCPLRLTNKTDDHVAFRCFPENLEIYIDGLSRLRGILPPRSTCTYVVMMGKRQQPPANAQVILETCVAYNYMTKSDVDDYFVFAGLREEGEGKVHEVTVMAVCDPAGETMASLPFRPRIKIMYCRDSYGPVLSVDVHPTEPWILAGHDDGYVSIWNYESQARVMVERITKERGNRNKAGYKWIPTAKFIARKQWFVSGDGCGYIYVHTYVTMGKLKEFKAHTGWVESLVIHPSDPFMLSASDDHLIKLWNWETNWECIRTFKAHSNNVQQVMFNPQNYNTFASVSKDGTAKIWSISSPVPVATLDCNGEQQICVDYFSTGGDQQYLVTGSSHGTARIWDLQTQRCIRQLRGLLCGWGCSVAAVDGLQGRPILITISSDFAVSLCNSTTYRQEKTFEFKLDRVRGLAYIKGIRSAVIGFEEGIAVMEII